MQPGQDFTDAVDAALSHADAVLAVIGPHWLTAAGADGVPRLANEDDYVRSELVAALSRTGPVIPVLVGGAVMPTEAQLPDDLKRLALLQAVTLRDESWHRDVEQLMTALGGDRPRARTRRWVIAAVVIGALLVAGGTALFLGGAGEPQSSSTTVGPSSQAESSTVFDPESVLPNCPGPSSGGFTSLGFSGATDVGSGGDIVARIEVGDGYYRKEEADRWYVLISATYTNMTDASEWQYWWFYELVLDRLTLKADCFSVTGGQNPSSPGATAEVLVGFDATVSPTDGGALLLKLVGATGRIDLVPT